MKKRIIQIVHHSYEGEYKKKFIEGIKYNKLIVPEQFDFSILDLSDYYLGENFNFDIDIKKLKINYFKPKNIIDLIKFLKSNRTYSLGLETGNLKLIFIFLLMQSCNVKFIFINYFGFFPQSSGNRQNNFYNKIKYFLNFKINYFFFRFLSIIYLTPKIEYYFESSQSRINSIKNSISKKIDKKININLFSYVNNIIRINSIYYEKFLEKKQNNKYIVFIDNGFDHPDRLVLELSSTEEDRANYYFRLYNFLKSLKNMYNLEVVFCKHPKAFYPNKNYIRIIENDFILSTALTHYYIPKAEIVVLSETTLLNKVILLNKKIITIYSSLMGDFTRRKILSIKNEIELFHINIDDYSPLSREILNNKLKKKLLNYKNYIRLNLVYKKNVLWFNQIKNFLKII